MSSWIKRIIIIFLLGLCMASCYGLQTKTGLIDFSQATIDEIKSALPTITPTPFQPEDSQIYISPGIPEDWRISFLELDGFSFTKNPEEAEVSFSFFTNDQKTEPDKIFVRVFAAVVPFFTVRDGISSSDLQRLWVGHDNKGPFYGILCSKESAELLTNLFGEPGTKVLITEKTEIQKTLSKEEGYLGLVPFEDITPGMKVLKVDGSSPLDKPLNQGSYFLLMKFGLFIVDGLDSSLEKSVFEISEKIPKTNRDEGLMTVIVMSGTTAITRGTASKVVLKGVDYPIEAVKDWFLTADLRHVSNEISFAEDCPEPDPFTGSLRFCAQPEAIEVLEKLGINVVELTGNHENDYGTENFSYTIDLYKKRGWATFGGGLDPDSAKQPALLENNGNKIAFIGCNPVGPTNAWVRENYPGVADCDYEYFYSKISSLKEQGYVVIATYQFDEIYQYMYADEYRSTFREATRAGADIVQGSQAHYPMGFELINDRLIHYGLGNFLFDQMDYPVEGTRREFIDRHIVYNGKYINTELLTALLTDWSRPVPMVQAEREQFLKDLFEASLER